MSKNIPKKKQKAYLWGQGAEWLSMVMLILKGYRILAHRFKCKSGEIDIIAQRGIIICFVEVKARQTIKDALSAVSYHQKNRIIKAAEWYIAKKTHAAVAGDVDISYRFDMVAVEPWAWPTHVKDAWQMDAIK